MKRRAAGFTIVEVLFVLAIAGIIMLTVFLAVPALQRNARNNQRKQDVAAVLSAVSHYELNNSGNFPVCGTAGASCFTGANNFLQDTATKLTYYDRTNAASVLATLGTAGSGTRPAPTSLETVQLYNYSKCGTSGGGAATPAGAGYSDIVALYLIESGNTTTPQCQQL